MSRTRPADTRPLLTEQLGIIEYQTASDRMLAYTRLRRTHPQPDVILLCEHPPVYTQGVAGRNEHLLHPGSIPVVRSSRGGQATYHGPGQLIAYPLLDLRARGFFVRELVARLESATLATLQHFGISGVRAPGAPGVYVAADRRDDNVASQPAPAFGTASPQNLKQEPQHMGLAKIAALGIKVSHGCSYHGVALNVDMDTRPFRNINPCGYAGLQTTDMRSLNPDISTADVLPIFQQKLLLALA